MKRELCNICPRGCNVNRLTQKGFCRESELRIAKIIKHFKWEEPCLAGEKGTLAIFFSGCNLGCDYCQNHEISHGGVGKIYSIEQFCDLISREQDSHDSIDLITPTHFSKALGATFEKIEKHVPVIWNTSGYETAENIKNVSSFVDIFLTDLKYADDEIGKNFSNCNNYFTYALSAIKQMCEKEDKFYGEQMMQGAIIRHLILPGYVENSLRVLDVIKKNFPDRIVSVMSQFVPNGKGILNKKINKIEYKLVLSHLQKLGLARGYIQDLDSADENFVPKFI